MRVAWLASDVSNRYDQLGTTRDLEEVVVLNREALDTFARKATHFDLTL
jgi:hypothetical protein